MREKEYEESIEEMHHADWLIKRILFLGGLPNVQRLNQVLVGQSVKEVLEADMRLEEKALDDLREGWRAWYKPLSGNRIRLRHPHPAVSGAHARQS